MKTKSHFYGKNLLLLFLLLAGTIPSFGQGDIFDVDPGVAALDDGSGLVTYTVTGASEEAHIFTLYGDGTFGNLSTPEHQFSHDDDYTTTVYIVEPYEDILPTSIVEVPIEVLGAAGAPGDNPEVAMNGEVDIMTSWATASGHENFFIVAFKNISSYTPVGGQVVLHYSDEEMTITGDVLEREGWVSPHNSTTSVLPAYNTKISWEFAGLAHGETRYIYVPATMLLSEGERIELKAEYITGKGRNKETVDTEDSVFRIHGDPHDPNFKVVDRTCIHPDDSAQRLVYTVGFFNDGINFATNVTLYDELSTWLNPATFAVLDAEYDNTSSIDGYDLEIEFVDINLPGTNQTYPNAYSYDEASTYVTFTICTNSSIPYDSCIDNTASIVFDTELPISTTTATVCSGQPCEESIACTTAPTFKQKPSPAEVQEPLFFAFPNPMNEKLNVSFANETAIRGPVVLEILDYTGKRVKQLWQTTGGLTTFPQQFELGVLAPGLYLLTLKTEDKVYTQKLIKQ